MKTFRQFFISPRASVAVLSSLILSFIMLTRPAPSQQLKDISLSMAMPVGSYYIDTTGIASIDTIRGDILNARSFSRRGFYVAIPTSVDPSPSSTVLGTVVPRLALDTSKPIILAIPNIFR